MRVEHAGSDTHICTNASSTHTHTSHSTHSTHSHTHYTTCLHYCTHVYIPPPAHTHTHTLTHSLTHSHTHSLTHSLTHSHTHSQDISNDTNRPAVHSLSVRLSPQHLRCHIPRCTTRGSKLVHIFFRHLGETKVTDHDLGVIRWAMKKGGWGGGWG